MALNDFVRRSMQIVAGGIVESTTDYFDNIISFANDTKEVIEMGRQTGSDSVKKFNEFRHSGIGKKIHDWFYNEGGMFGDFDFDDDDFDAGFEIDSADSEDGESPKPLSKDMISDIAKKQTGAMYKAFAKQTEMQMASTAEIVSTISTRTAELTASVNNVNNTLIQIGKRLDLIVEWTSARTKQTTEYKTENPIFDYGGGVSLSGVVNQFKANAEDSMLGTFLSMGKTMLGSGMMTPEAVFSMILSNTLLDKKWKGLGKKSINDIGEFFNDMTGEIIQNALTKILTTRNEFFKDIFEDIIEKSGRKNYQREVVNQYNDKPAVFDGMTRKSIITVIPGYLNEILKAVNNGKGKSINDKGELSDKQTNAFVNKVSDLYFRSGTVGYEIQEKISGRIHTLSRSEITAAIRTMTACWVYMCYRSGRIIRDVGQVTDPLNPTTRIVLNNTAYMLSTKTKGRISEAEWLEHLLVIISELDEYKYRTEIQKTAISADQGLTNFARNDLQGNQSGVVNEDIMMAALNKNWSDFTPTKKDGTRSDISPTPIGSDSPIHITTVDYLSGIMKRLNTGINVFVTGSKNLRKKPYDEILVTAGMAPSPSATKAVVSPIDSSSSTSSSSSEGSKLKTVEKAKPEWWGDADPEIRKIYEKSSSERSADEKRYLEDFHKHWKESHKDKEKSFFRRFIDDSRKEGIVADPEAFETIEFIKEKLSKLLPSRAKKAIDKVKETEAYKTVKEKVDNSDIAKSAKEKINKGGAKVVDAVYGKRIKTWSGEDLGRDDDGILEKADKKVTKFKEGGYTPKSILNSRYKQLKKEYSSDKSFDKDTDQYYAQLAISSVNTAISDGDVSTSDETSVKKIISKIKDVNIRREFEKTLIPMMRNNAKNNSKNDASSTGTKSTLGKLGTMVLGATKMVLKPVFTYIKVILWGVYNIITRTSKGLFKLLKWGVTGGLNKITYGAKSLASGVTGIFNNLTNLAGKPIKKFVDIAYGAVEKMNGWFSDIKDKIANIGKSNKNNAGEDDSSSGDKKQGIISRAKNWFSEKSETNDFIKGLTKASRERKEAERKASIKEQSEPTKAALDETGVPEIKTGVESLVDLGKDLQKSLDVNGSGLAAQIHSDLEELTKATMGETKGSDNNEIASSTSNKNETGAVATGFSIGDGGGNGGSTEQEGSWNAPNTSGATASNVGNFSSTEMGSKSPQTYSANMKSSDSSEKGGEKSGSMLESIGSVVGGIASGIMGIVQIVMTLATYVEGAKLLVDTVMNILVESLKPLNDGFQVLLKALKPLLKQVGGIVKQLAGYISDIVEVLMDIIKPILEDVVKPILDALSPLLDTIISLLIPVLKVVGIILKVILAPLMGIFKYILMPIIKIIGDCVQVIAGLLMVVCGIIEVAFGGLMEILGIIVSAIGNVIKIVSLGTSTGVADKGQEILDKGMSMAEEGKNYFVEGAKLVGKGIAGIVLDTLSLFTLGGSDQLLRPPDDTEEQKEVKHIEATEENTVQNTYASGDVDNSTNTNIYNTYGGEYQRGMGGYLNMDQRGCGPIALADMYNRRIGGMSARSLAGSMYGAGTYDPNRGTSVGGYIDTARAMGMNLRAGGVSQQSLKLASPRNPITVVGSGSDYGTKRGNNHFMNVIGTDSHGGAYVSNPLTGRVERKPTSTIAGSAVMGIYGSGDEGADGGYSFPTAIKEAFKKLKEEAAKILGLFSMDKSDEDEVDELITAEQDKEALEQAKRELGDDYETYAKEARAEAFKDYQTQYPKRDGQSDDEYNAAFEKWYSTRESQYIAETELMDKASENNKNGWQTIQNTSDSFVNALAGEVDENGNRTGGLFDQLGQASTAAYDEMLEYSKSSGGSSNGGPGAFSTESGKSRLALDNPTITDVDMTIVDTSIGDGGGYYHAPLIEFFSKTGGAKSFLYGYNFYNRYGTTNRNDHTKEGVGTNGGTHQGIDLHWIGENANGKIPIYAPTDGTLELKQPEAKSGGGGNYVSMIDNDGNRHRFMHMHHFSNEINNMASNGKIIGGKTILGYEGNTGASTGTHTHYDIYLNGGNGQHVNPLTYFSKYNPLVDQGVLSGDTVEEQIYSYLVTSGMTPIGAAGLMGCFKYESDMRSNNLENSYNDQFGLSDEEYTSRVNSGQESENQFITGRNATAWSGQTPGEAVGYGIAQFTSSDLKRDIYNKTVKQGKSIASLDTQLDAIMEVLKSRGIYDTINNAKTPTDANKTFLWKYEAGTGYTSDEAVLKAYPWMLNTNPNGVELRHQYAEQIYNTYKDWTPSAATNTFNTSGGGTVLSINSASDAKIYKALQTTGSTSGTGTGVVITQNDPLNVRSSKSINSDIIGQIPPGTEVAIEYRDSSQWLYVPEYGGYVSADYIRIITNDNTNKTWIGQNGSSGSSSTGYGTVQSPGDASYYYGDSNVLTYNPKPANTVSNERQYSTDVESLLPSSDPAWQANWYTNYKNYPYFMKQDSSGHYSATSDGMLQRLTNMGNKLYMNMGKSDDKKNQYYKNFKKRHGNLTDQIIKDMYNDAGSPQEWLALRNRYVLPKSTADRTLFPESLSDLHYAMYGSGDVESGFWDNYLGWNNDYSNISIPPIDGNNISSNITDEYGTPTGVVVNNYDIKRTDDIAASERLSAILANTYNVRSETMEALLNEILLELKRRKNNGDKGGSGTTPKLFDERIPSQVARLSIG